VGALRPNVGQGEDIATALKRLADLGQRTARTPIDLVIDELPRLGDAVEREIIGIAQEALTNAVRHSRARRITIRASAVRAVGLRLSVADDGRGIGRERSTAGFGMTSMQERADRIGASLTIVTPPRNGTEVVIAREPAALPTRVQLTPREMATLALLADGKANKEIASALDISERTVKTHLTHLFEKLGATSRTEAVKVATRRGLVRLE